MSVEKIPFFFFWSQCEAFRQITLQQTTLGRSGDNGPNVVPQTETSVTAIFSCKMN